MKNKAIIFDMGGVLIDLDIEACKDAFKRDLGFMDIDVIIDPCHQKGIWGDLEEGKITADQFRKTVMERSGKDVMPEDVDKAMSYILVGITPDKVELLKILEGKYDIYMLSNNNPICTEMARVIFRNAGIDMDACFKKCYLSYQMQMLKPSDQLYKAVIEDIGMPAENMIFIDDSMKNVEAALNAGLPSVYYEPGSDLAALVSDVLQDPSILSEGGRVC